MGNFKLFYTMLAEDDTPKTTLNYEEDPADQDQEFMDVGAKIIGEGLDEIRKSAKQSLQLSWTDIHIYTQPVVPKCSFSKQVDTPPSKTIIDHVSGTVMPG